MALEPVGGGAVSTDAYTLVAVSSDFEVVAGRKLQPIEVITVTSDLYGVTFTFNVSQTTFNADGARNLAGEKTAEVNAIAGYDNVVGVRWEQDQGSDGNLYNYLVATVGTPDGAIATDVQIRMDLIGEPSAFQAIDKAWSLLKSLGA